MSAKETFWFGFLIPDYACIVYSVNNLPLPVHAYCFIYCKAFVDVSGAHPADSVKTALAWASHLRGSLSCRRRTSTRRTTSKPRTVHTQVLHRSITKLRADNGSYRCTLRGREPLPFR